MFPTVDSEDYTQGTSGKIKTSTSRDEPESSEKSRGAKQYNRELTLKMLLKELFVCIALFLTTYGALHNTSAKISKHPQAVRFFSSDSKVKDWYKGQLRDALIAVNRADISFVMYYAPWDAESQYVREEFEKAASVLSHRVYFSAINCWNPGSECRMQHNKIPSWPILMVYSWTSRGILYKGPRDAHSMVNFLELVMKPLSRVSSTEDLIHLLSICDAVAVGYTPMSSSAKYFDIWYNVALKTKEFDIIGEICFGAVTSEELAIDLGVDKTPNARLMLWNDTKEYMTDEINLQMWNESLLTMWVLGSFTQPVARVIPMWKKAFTFQRYIDGNPILMLFTPLNPLYQQQPSYALLREVIMEYYNCKNNESSQWISELIKLQQVQRLLYQQKDLIKFCEQYQFKIPISKHNIFNKKGVISRNNKYLGNNTMKKPSKSVFNFMEKDSLTVPKIVGSVEDDSQPQFLSPLNLLEKCNSKCLPAEKNFYDYYEDCESLEDNLNSDYVFQNGPRDIETTILPSEDDPLSPENLMQDNVKHFCKLVRFAKELGSPIVPSKPKGNITYIHGLGCTTNYTLHAIALDSVRNHHFAESLGIDIVNKKDMTAVVILDSKHESQYVMSEEYSAKSIRDFLYNFTNKSLKRTLRSHVEDAAHTHYFGSDVKEHRDDDNNTIHIMELTTRTFKKVVNTPATMTLVAVCGGACSASIVRAVATAARLLSACGLRVRPARLDALRHDLPWQYTPHAYPALLVFPARGGGGGGGEAGRDSRAVPAGRRVSAGGAVGAALHAVAPPARLRVRLALCAHTQGITARKTCLMHIREHVETVIGRNLKYWRRTDNKDLKDALLKRLQHLHRVSLELSILHISDLSNYKQKPIVHFLSTLSDNWDIDLRLLKRHLNQSIS